MSSVNIWWRKDTSTVSSTQLANRLSSDNQRICLILCFVILRNVTSSVLCTLASGYCGCSGGLSFLIPLPYHLRPQVSGWGCPVSLRERKRERQDVISLQLFLWLLTQSSEGRERCLSVTWPQRALSPPCQKGPATYSWRIPLALSQTGCFLPSRLLGLWKEHFVMRAVLPTEGALLCFAGCGGDRWRAHTGLGRPGLLRHGHPCGQAGPVHRMRRSRSTAVPPRPARCGHQQWGNGLCGPGALEPPRKMRWGGAVLLWSNYIHMGCFVPRMLSTPIPT